MHKNMERLLLQAEGRTLSGAFIRAAERFAALVYDPTTVEPRESVEIFCESADLELLYADWINTLIYEIHHRGMLFSRFEVHVEGINIRGRILGERRDPSRHRILRAETRGIAFTELEVWEERGHVFVRAVLDDDRHVLRL